MAYIIKVEAEAAGPRQNQQEAADIANLVADALRDIGERLELDLDPYRVTVTEEAADIRAEATDVYSAD